MAEFKTLQFPNTAAGQRNKNKALEIEAANGWRVVSETIIPGKFRGGNACCLFLICAPCAFLAGHEDDIISVTLERNEGAGTEVNEHKKIDRAKWNALIEYDPAIASAVKEVSPFGEKWLDELASAYLALNDIKYLPNIVEGIVRRAQLEKEEVAKQDADRKREQERLEAEKAESRRKEAERRLMEREQRGALLDDVIQFFWGTQTRRTITIWVIFVSLLLICLIFEGS